MIGYVREEMKKTGISEQTMIGIVWTSVMSSMEWNKKEELVTEQAIKHLKVRDGSRGCVDALVLLRYCFYNAWPLTIPPPAKFFKFIYPSPLCLLQQYSPLLNAFTTQGLSELTLLLKIQEYCYDNIHFMKAFQKIVVLLYKGACFSQGVVWRWEELCGLYSNLQVLGSLLAFFVSSEHLKLSCSTSSAWWWP